MPPTILLRTHRSPHNMRQSIQEWTFFKGFFPQNLLSPLLNTLSYFRDRDALRTLSNICDGGFFATINDFLPSTILEKSFILNVDRFLNIPLRGIAKLYNKVLGQNFLIILGLGMLGSVLYH